MALIYLDVNKENGTAREQRKKILLHDHAQGTARNEKKRSCQTSNNTHSIQAAEANPEGVKIITTLYTATSMKTCRHLCRQCEGKKVSLLGIADRIIVQDGFCSSFERLRRGRLL